MSEVIMRIGAKTVRMRLITWREGAAVTCIEDAEQVVKAPAKEAHVFSWNPKTGEINRRHDERAET
jgi:hypothetical protein